MRGWRSGCVARDGGLVVVSSAGVGLVRVHTLDYARAAGCPLAGVGGQGDVEDVEQEVFRVGGLQRAVTDGRFARAVPGCVVLGDV